MLFAQAVGVAQACIEAAPSPVMAFAQTDHDGNCGEMVNRNACLQHCTAGDQSSAQAQVEVAAMPAIAALTVPVAPDRVAYSVAAWVGLAHFLDPPSSIRFCSFQL
jgi:hypothetical protein